MRLKPTSSQTVGPFFHHGLMWLKTPDLAAGASEGEKIEITGTIVDGDGAVVPDAILELWQANSHGRYNHPADRQNRKLDPGFTGFGRICTDKTGRFRFTTIRPGAVPGVDGKPQAPHINVILFMRGQLTHLYTRLYFAGDPALAQDEVLAKVEPSRRSTLLAQPVAGQPGHYQWNIVMQGEKETVFFAF
ncbi:MAG: protocatechuate 3,4-dioxygenase [Alphaproteobacteria bacterium]|jgi:protocatechuate 3,4-dioxygenase alpha subunit|nr:protocatechuate 3,4-dioxygenase [Alphaproteobacteria bacterium]